MLLTVLMATVTASASDIGESRRFGLGIQVGTSQTVTLKAYFNPWMGIALHGGITTALGGVHARAQFEMEFFEIHDWDFGRLDLYWNAGFTVTGIVTGSHTGARPGLHGGIGIEMQLHPVPLQVFLEVDPVFYPFWTLSEVEYFPLGVHVGLGARWYF